MIRTRFAPSPTGFLHIGSLRTAIYSFALAKHNQGQFLLRIEDTDQKREVTGAVEGIFQTLKKFGLNWDLEPVVQSERAKEGVYIKAAEQLVSQGYAFYCQCEARNAKTEGFNQILRDPCRDKKYTSGAIKLRIPDGEKINYHDYILDKEISWNSDALADTTILKSESMDRLPTYHLAVVVDDVFMEITHALRGHDWLPSTPIHLLVYKYLGLKQPQIGHLSDIQSPNGGKLSKRRDSVFCETFLEQGYLLEALFNFVILLGWAPKDNRELFTLDEFVKVFDPKGFQKSNPLFTYNKLDWLNGQYIRQKSDTELIQLVKPFVKNKLTDKLLTQIIPLIKDRLVKLSDINQLSDFFITPPELTPELFSDGNLIIQQLKHVVDWIKSHEFSKPGLETGWTDIIKSNNWKVGDYFMSLRLAVCGSRSTPPITETLLVLGQDESISRIQKAKEIISQVS
jgi:glutamyl-tRNA synthetase